MVEYEQFVDLKDRMQTELKKQNIRVEIQESDHKSWEYEDRFDLEIHVDMHHVFKTWFVVTYFKDREIPFWITHCIYTGKGIAKGDIFLRSRIQELYKQCKSIETVLESWIKEQSSLRLEYMFNPWLQKQIPIRRIESYWESERQERVGWHGKV